jgi:uncharacterized membrane protein YtjA (UPF0391 family)
MTAIWVALFVIVLAAALLRLGPRIIVLTGLHKVVFFVATILLVISVIVDLARTPRGVVVRHRF